MTAGDNTGATDTGIAEAALLRRFQWTSVAVTAFVLSLLVAVAALYYLKTFERLTDRQAMDSAQIARNICEGQGFSTRFVRPFNVGFLKSGAQTIPEMNTAPVFPYAVSAVFRVMSISDQAACWTSLGFHILLLAATFLLGTLLFDYKTGLTAGAFVGLSAPMLNSAVSGSQVPLEGFEMTALLVLVALHRRSISAGASRAVVLYSLASGVVASLLYATNYVLAFVLVPAAVYFWVADRKKAGFAVFLGASVVLMTPLAYRNGSMTGFPLLGARAWDIMAQSSAYPGDTLLRSVDKAAGSPLRPLLFPVEEFGAFTEKAARTAGGYLASLAAMLGPAVLSFAVVSALYRFRETGANAVRGLAYGLAPLALLVLGLYSESPDHAQIFAPAVAVYASAYLSLLLKAKGMHQFFARAFVGVVLVITAVQTLSVLAWGIPRGGAADQRTAEVNNFYANLGTRGVRYVLYTDVPWIAAWRTMGLGVWLPLSDSDVYALEARGLYMRAIILTPECENYSSDETWRMLHEVRLWRQYIENPSAAEKEILRLANIKSRDFAKAAKSLWRLRRQYRISSSVSGFVTQPSDPLGPDYIQVLLHPDSVPSR